jgi:hypothetical protein
MSSPACKKFEDSMVSCHSPCSINLNICSESVSVVP